MYIHPALVGKTFLRLLESEPTAKTGVERTTGLFRFLAFDALCKLRGDNALLLDPETGIGHQNREDLITQYTKIALVKLNNDRKEWIVDNLGSCNTDGRRTCNDKVANDFLTTPLKKASESGEVLPYPKRPASLVNLGIVIDGKPWGISKHDNWQKNIYNFMSDRRSPFFWTDFAIFLARNEEFAGKDFWEELAGFLSSKFTEELSGFWKVKIRFEKRKFSDKMDIKNWTSETLVNELSKDKYSKPRNVDKDEIIKTLREENAELKARGRELEDEIDNKF